MLLDIQFNVKGGIDSFPKFTEAVLDNDINTMQEEYKRYFKNKQGEYEELARNKSFSSFFFGDIKSCHSARESISEYTHSVETFVLWDLSSGLKD